VGELSLIGVDGFDRVDNVLLEMQIAMALRAEPDAAVQAVLPVSPPTPYTSHPTPYTLHPAPYTLRPTPYTLHPTPDTYALIS